MFLLLGLLLLLLGITEVDIDVGFMLLLIWCLGCGIFFFETEVLELTEGKGLFFLIERNFELVLGNVALLTLDDLIFCDDVI